MSVNIKLKSQFVLNIYLCYFKHQLYIYLMIH